MKSLFGVARETANAVAADRIPVLMTRGWAGLAVLLLCLSAPLAATLTCSPPAVVPTDVRAEGVTEPLSDIIFTCTGGAPTASGVPVPGQNLQLFTNINLSNRLDPSGFLDAFLIIDEPHSVANPTCPLIGVYRRVQYQWHR